MKIYKQVLSKKPQATHRKLKQK